MLSFESGPDLARPNTSMFQVWKHFYIDYEEKKQGEFRFMIGESSFFYIRGS